MKRIILFTFIIFSITAGYAQRLISETFTYIEGVTCTVNGYSTMKMFAAAPGEGVTYAAKSGHTLVKLRLDIKNNTQELQQLELGDFEIIDTKGKHYMACLAIQNFKVNDMQYLSREIKPGKERTYYVLYCEDFPKEETPVAIAVKGREIPLTEKK